MLSKDPLYIFGHHRYISKIRFTSTSCSFYQTSNLPIYYLSETTTAKNGNKIMHERPINQLPKPRIPKDKYENAISGGHKKCNPKNIWFNCKVRSSACQINQYIRRRRRRNSSSFSMEVCTVQWLVLFRPNGHNNIVFKADRLLNFCRYCCYTDGWCGSVAASKYVVPTLLKIRCLHTKCMVAVMIQQ